MFHRGRATAQRSAVLTAIKAQMMIINIINHPNKARTNMNSILLKNGKFTLQLTSQHRLEQKSTRPRSFNDNHPWARFQARYSPSDVMASQPEFFHVSEHCNVFEIHFFVKYLVWYHHISIIQYANDRNKERANDWSCRLLGKSHRTNIVSQFHYVLFQF
ncbi:hypothetical protein GYMLUDRAFT_300314 [Collybiopsis luxurians FD-317 M1]|nr:hypothetical protein GYMLUDRAFT_300314 [Collybiopsis luxurians FD-317 M1]